MVFHHRPSRRILIVLTILTLMLLACQATAVPTPPVITPVFMPTVEMPPADAIDPSAPNPCKLPEGRGYDVGIGFPLHKNRIPSTGNVRGIVLFVDFEDAPAKQTTRQVFSMLSPDAPDFFRAISYGRFNLGLEPHHSWLRMTLPSKGYISDGVPNIAYIEEVFQMAEPLVDFSGADAVYIIAAPNAKAITTGPAFMTSDRDAFILDGQTIQNGVTSASDLSTYSFRWLSHETGHLLGLPDLYAESYDSNNHADQYRYVGDFSVMGSLSATAPEYFAYERWLLGWLDDQQVVCHQSGEQTVTLTAVEIAGGVKAVMVPTSHLTALVIESRRPFGYDVNLVESGVLVYTVDTTIAGGQGPINVLAAKENDYYRRLAPLSEGESFTAGKVTITVMEATDTGDTVQVMVSE